MKLYSDFLQSDIVVASPIALATKLAEESDEEGGLADFLSSIEMAIVDRADVQLMQNWAHVVTGDTCNTNTLIRNSLTHIMLHDMLSAVDLPISALLSALQIHLEACIHEQGCWHEP